LLTRDSSRLATTARETSDAHNPGPCARHERHTGHRPAPPPLAISRRIRPSARRRHPARTPPTLRMCTRFRHRTVQIALSWYWTCSASPDRQRCSPTRSSIDFEYGRLRSPLWVRTRPSRQVKASSHSTARSMFRAVTPIRGDRSSKAAVSRRAGVPFHFAQTTRTAAQTAACRCSRGSDRTPFFSTCG
jgi:hypothetical protein